MNRQQGFTILEALIASVLFFLALSVAVMSFTAGSQNFISSQDTIKACHNSYNVLNMLATELREADPASITTLPSNTTTITFKKFHNPTTEDQVVTWELDPGGSNRVIRTYMVGAAPKGQPVFFGDNIMNLRFNGTSKMVSGQKLIIINIMMDAQSEVQGAGNSRRKIIQLNQDVYIRKDQPAILDIYYI